MPGSSDSDNKKLELIELAHDRAGYIDLGDGSPPWPCLEFDFQNNEFLHTMSAADIPLERKQQYIANFKKDVPLQQMRSPEPTSMFLLFGKGEHESSLCFQGELMPYFLHRKINKHYNGKYSEAWDSAQKELMNLLIQNSRAQLVQTSKPDRVAPPVTAIATAPTTTTATAAVPPTTAAGGAVEPLASAPIASTIAIGAEAVSAAFTTTAAATIVDEQAAGPVVPTATLPKASPAGPDTAENSATRGPSDLDFAEANSDGGKAAAQAAIEADNMSAGKERTLMAEREKAHGSSQAEDMLVDSANCNADGTALSVPAEIDSTNHSSAPDGDDVSEMGTTCFRMAASPGCANTVVTSSPLVEQSENPGKAFKIQKRRGRPKQATKAKASNVSKKNKSSTPKMPNARKEARTISTKNSGRKVALVLNEPLSAPAFNDVVDALQRFGYTFPSGLYCLPGHTRTDSSGTGCFKTETEFRLHLCKHGVEGDGNTLSDHDRKQLIKWVRFAIVSTEDIEGQSSNYSLPLNASGAYFILKSLGVKYGGGIFDAILPNVERKAMITGVNAFVTTDGPTGLHAYLAQNGLPADFAFDNISTLERYALEVFLATHPSAEQCTFMSPGRQALDEGVGQPARRNRNRKRKTSDEVVPICKPLAGKRARPAQRASAPKSKCAPQVGKEALIVPEMMAQSSPSNTIATSPLVAKMAKAAMPVSMRLIEPRCVPLPDQKASIGEKLEACLEVLKTSYQASSPIIDSTLMPHFANNLLMVENFVRSAVVSEGANGGKEGDCASIYVCGGPGIGKTSGVRYICEKVIKAAHVDDDCRSPILCYVNAVSINASLDPLESLFREMASVVGSQSAKSPSSLKAILSRTPHSKFIILVLDEIDALVSDTTSDIHFRSELALKKLLECAADENYPLALIGISNTIGNDKFDRMHGLGKFQRTIKFRRFAETELLHIVQDRIGTKVVAEPALKLITKKVAQASGDVRAALDMVADAVKFRLDGLSSLERGAFATMTKPLVTAKEHMLSSKLVQDSVAERVRGIPLFGTIVLCVMATLARDQVQVAKIKDLRECVLACLVDFPENQTMTMENFNDSLDMLVDQNLLRMDRVSGDGRSRLSAAQYNQVSVRLGTQLEDVCDVVKKELVDKQGFWAKIEHKAHEQWQLMSDE